MKILCRQTFIKTELELGTFREKHRLAAPSDVHLAVARTASRPELTGTGCHPVKISPTVVRRMTSCTCDIYHSHQMLQSSTGKSSALSSTDLIDSKLRLVHLVSHLSMHCDSEKRYSSYDCHNFVYRQPIFMILADIHSVTLQEICNNNPPSTFCENETLLHDFENLDH